MVPLKLVERHRWMGYLPLVPRVSPMMYLVLILEKESNQFRNCNQINFSFISIQLWNTKLKQTLPKMNSNRTQFVNTATDNSLSVFIDSNVACHPVLLHCWKTVNFKVKWRKRWVGVCAWHRLRNMSERYGCFWLELTKGLGEIENKNNWFQDF